jgi:hypothetical protein
MLSDHSDCFVDRWHRLVTWARTVGAAVFLPIAIFFVIVFWSEMPLWQRPLQIAVPFILLYTVIAGIRRIRAGTHGIIRRFKSPANHN